MSNRRPVKAYKNLEFLNSPDARPLRILAEYLEPQSRFRLYDVEDTIVFFGSARVIPGEVARKEYEYWKKRVAEAPSPDHQASLRHAERQLHMSRYYDEARELARLLTEWSLKLNHKHRRFLIVSGGGPGIMEAANRGASDVPGGRSVGLNISIPTEQEPNPYITDELNFEFHYFFMRKFWFIYLAKALIVFPGGFGTLDELFEVLTLVQTKKLTKPMPIVIYGKEYWSQVINFQAMVDHLTIHETDLHLFKFCDSPQEAFEYLKDKLTEYFLTQDV